VQFGERAGAHDACDQVAGRLRRRARHEPCRATPSVHARKGRKAYEAPEVFVDGSATALWAWLPVEWRVAAEGAWAEGRYALVNAADRAECVAWLAGRWGWRAPDNRPAAGVSLADVTVRDVTTLFEHATRARRAAKLAAFVAEALFSHDRRHSDASKRGMRCDATTYRASTRSF